MELFAVENLKVAYPTDALELTQAVDGVSFTLSAGERLGLVGESGCGKSTLGRAAMGLLSSNTTIEGDVKFQGKSVFQLNPSELRQFRGEAVALVFQDPMTRLDPLMTIGDHCLETLRAHQRSLSYTQAKTKALETLASVKIPPDRWGQYPHEFSGGMRQRVALALALLLEPKLIVADEPTTSLDVTIAREILSEITRLCQERNMGLLLISHDLAMIGAYCDRVAVMYQGKVVECGAVSSVLINPTHHYTKTLLNAAFKPRKNQTKIRLTAKTSDIEVFDPNLQPQSNPLLKVKSLFEYYTLESNFVKNFLGEKTVIKAVDDVSFDLYLGECLGLVGESGCGKSTLSRTILQLIKPTKGIVEFQGQDLTKLNNKQMRASRRSMQMVFQDPHACLNPTMTVGENIAEPLLIHNLATPEEAKSQGETMLLKVGLTPVKEYYKRFPKELSGGQQQRVAIARALITRPKLVICDEPVSMLDATIQYQVLELMSQLKAEFDLTYLFITHDLTVARFFCDRIAVMYQGKIIELADTETIFTNPQHSYTQKLLQSAPALHYQGEVT